MEMEARKKIGQKQKSCHYLAEVESGPNFRLLPFSHQTMFFKRAKFGQRLFEIILS